MITVIIPTNRYDCIKEIIEKKVLPYKGELFTFEIHDSSNDERMPQFIRKILDKNTCKLRYYKYPSEITADDKTVTALQNIHTQFFWLMGDGVLADFNRMDELLSKLKIGQYAFIDLESTNRIGHMGQDKGLACNKIYSYKDIPLYAEKYFSHITYWGSQLVQTQYFQKAYSNGILQKYRQQQIPWWIACVLFELFANSMKIGNSLKVGVLYVKFITSNPVKKDHWWAESEKYYEYTFTQFNKGINLLPDFYDQLTKKNIIKNFRQDSLVNDFYLIHLKAIGNLSITMLKKYRKEIEVIPETYQKMCLYNRMPKIFAQLLNYLMIQVKPLYLKIKRRWYD